MFAYCNNNPVNNKDSKGSHTVEATRTGDLINVTVKEERKIGSVDCLIVIEAELNFIEDYEFEWGDAKISIGSTGIDVTAPWGEGTYEYKAACAVPTSVDVPIISNQDFLNWKFSEDGFGICCKWECGMEDYSVTCYPHPNSLLNKILEKCPAPPTGSGGYSNFGARGGTGCGANWPLRNVTSQFM